MEEIRNILTDLGYVVVDNGTEYRARPIYRDSGNANSLRIKKSNGWWNDFGIGKAGSFAELVKITLNLQDIKDAYNYLQDKHKFNPQNLPVERPKLKADVKFHPSILDKLQKDYTYWNCRGISDSILKEFECGISYEIGKMKDRYVFPIFNSKKEIIGLSGRTLKNSSIKWKHLGPKSEWKYPLFLNYKLIREKKEVILVESIGDCLSLFEAGIRNVIVIFGTEISHSLISTIIKLDPKKIYISLNHEPNNDSIGDKAAEKAKTKLSRYFDLRQLKIKPPILKDFNDMLLNDKGSIAKWYENCSL